MIDFPNSPALNQIFTDPAGTSWIWDGAKWTAAGTGYLPLSGGNMTGVLTANPGLNSSNVSFTGGTIGASVARLGVVNGSNAAAGQIGEFLTATATTPVANGVVTNITSLVLSAGDWNVYGNAAIGGSPTGITAFTSCLNLTSANIGGTFFNLQATMQGASFAIPAQRQNVTSNTTIYLVGSMSYTGGSGNIVGIINARRMR